MLARASDEEALRLALAFYCIMEPECRQEVLALAERLATKSQRVDGVAHFLDLTPAHKNQSPPRRG
jgi:hypothetical protein